MSEEDIGGGLTAMQLEAYRTQVEHGPETLVERLRSPMWVHSVTDFANYASPQLDIESTKTSMDEAADEIERLSKQLVRARKAFHGTALMMRYVDEWPNNQSIVSHVDCDALRELRAVLALTDDVRKPPPGGISMEEAAAENFGLTEDDL